MSDVVRIDCDECVMQHTEVCADCVVTFLCSRQPDEAIIIDVAEVRALRLLSEAGLAPRLVDAAGRGETRRARTLVRRREEGRGRRR